MGDRQSVDRAATPPQRGDRPITFTDTYKPPVGCPAAMAERDARPVFGEFGIDDFRARFGDLLGTREEMMQRVDAAYGQWLSQYAAWVADIECGESGYPQHLEGFGCFLPEWPDAFALAVIIEHAATMDFVVADHLERFRRLLQRPDLVPSDATSITSTMTHFFRSIVTLIVADLLVPVRYRGRLRDFNGVPYHAVPQLREHLPDIPETTSPAEKLVIVMTSLVMDQRMARTTPEGTALDPSEAQARFHRVAVNSILRDLKGTGHGSAFHPDPKSPHAPMSDYGSCTAERMVLAALRALGLALYDRGQDIATAMASFDAVPGLPARKDPQRMTTAMLTRSIAGHTCPTLSGG